ncbi:MAG: ABC transporter ATP-binding protein [Bacillota bacterium]|nr:ABC transporter ATP-binding protein [Bacillota bacterium]
MANGSMTNEPKPMLEVEDLQVFYGAIQAIKGISFHVMPGEIVSLIGANGAGKTTCLQTISGLLHARVGDIRYEGQSLKRVPPHRIVEMGLAQVPEGRRVFTQLSVEDNLAMGAYTLTKRMQLDASARGTRGDVSDHEEALLEEQYRRFPRLKERRDQRAGTLSGGEQQMLAIARAMMSAPRLLLLDEPSMGLSPVLTREIFLTIRELAKQGITILLVEQNAAVALRLADRAYVLESGRLVMSGSGRELLRDERIREAYLGE